MVTVAAPNRTPKGYFRILDSIIKKKHIIPTATTVDPEIHAVFLSQLICSSERFIFKEKSRFRKSKFQQHNPQRMSPQELLRQLRQLHQP